MVVPPTAPDKLRKLLRQCRRTVSDTTTFPQIPAINDIIGDAVCVGSYLPIGGEPDPTAFLGNYAGVTSLPALANKDALMVFRSWVAGDPIEKAPWGGHQPPASAPVVTPTLIFVPMVGFDAAVNRIGQGGGHYDRYLAAHPQACRIGVAWECQRVDRIDARAWDVPMDAIVTEAGFYVKDLNRCRRH